MPNKWFKKLIPSKQATIENTPQFGGLRDYISQPALWHFNRESVARGVAAGLFIAVIPIMPFQMLLTIILSVLIRGNIPLALASCWANNPFTFVPIIYAPYYIGSILLATKETSHYDFSLATFSEIWSNFGYILAHFGKAYFLGLPIFAISLAIIGYFTVKLTWSIIDWLKLYH